MAYNITKSDGTPLATISDGQTNSTATSLTLVGKNFAGYGTSARRTLKAYEAALAAKLAAAE